MRGGSGIQFENAVASMLQKHVHFQEDSQGVSSALHYIRTKDDTEVDFVISEEQALTQAFLRRCSDFQINFQMRKLFNWLRIFAKKSSGDQLKLQKRHHGWADSLHSSKLFNATFNIYRPFAETLIITPWTSI